MRKVISIIMALVLCLAAFVGCGTGTSSESLEELIALGAQYLVDGHYSEAVVAFDKAIKVDDKSVVAYVGLGDGNLGLEDYEKAGETYEKAIEVDDHTVEAYIGRADAYLFEGNKESAVAILNEGFETTGNAELSNIIESINAGTYEPSVLHMDWESIISLDSAELAVGENEREAKGDSGLYIARIPAEAVSYTYKSSSSNCIISLTEYYDSAKELIERTRIDESGIFKSYNGDISEELVSKTLVTFDSEGYAEEEVTYILGNDGSTEDSYKCLFSWDPSRTKVTRKQFWGDEAFEPVFTTVVEYYEDGSEKVRRTYGWELDLLGEENFEMGELFDIENIGYHKSLWAIIL